jgi:hypothetical protein
MRARCSKPQTRHPRGLLSQGTRLRQRLHQCNGGGTIADHTIIIITTITIITTTITPER